MDPLLFDAALIAMAVNCAGVAAMAVAKIWHRRSRRWRGVRRAHYVAALGELLSRGVIPTRPPRAWAADPVFHDAVGDYRDMLAGPETRLLDDLVEALEITPVLVERARRRFPLRSRLRAMTSLAELATPLNTADLAQFLSDRNPYMRIQAARGLARLGHHPSVVPILEAAARAKPWEASRLVDSLEAMGPDGTPEIIRWMRTEMLPDGRHRMVPLCARVLGIVGDGRAESMLIEMLRSPSTDWRLAAASALEHCGSDLSIAPLRAALADPSWTVRARAVVALGALAAHEAVPDMEPLLSDEVWWVRQNASTALVRLPGGLEALRRAANGDDGFGADAARVQLMLIGADETTAPNPV